jgi:hypothetical protein
MRRFLHRLSTAGQQFEQATSGGGKEHLFSMYTLRGHGLPILRLDAGLIAVPEHLRQQQGLQRPNGRPAMIATFGSQIVHEHDIEWPVVAPPRTTFSRARSIPVHGFLLGPQADYDATERAADLFRRLRGPHDIRPLAVIGMTATRQLVEVLETQKVEWNDPGVEIGAYVFEAAADYAQRKA